METSLMVYDYPEPDEIKEKNIQLNINVSYTLNLDVPENWDENYIKQYVEEEFRYFDLCDEKIEYIEIN